MSHNVSCIRSAMHEKCLCLFQVCKYHIKATFFKMPWFLIPSWSSFWFLLGLLFHVPFSQKVGPQYKHVIHWLDTQAGAKFGDKEARRTGWQFNRNLGAPCFKGTSTKNKWKINTFFKNQCFVNLSSTFHQSNFNLSSTSKNIYFLSIICQSKVTRTSTLSKQNQQNINICSIWNGCWSFIDAQL